MTTRDRIALACVLASLATLAIYAGAALRSSAGYIVGALLGGAAFALTLNPPEDPT